jgi:hypothetical protein
MLRHASCAIEGMEHEPSTWLREMHKAVPSMLQPHIAQIVDLEARYISDSSYSAGIQVTDY